MVARDFAVLFRPGASDIIQVGHQRALDDPESFNPQSMANIMYSAAVFNLLDANTLKALSNAMARKEIMEDSYYLSLFHCCLAVQASSPLSPPSPALLPERMHEICSGCGKPRLGRCTHHSYITRSSRCLAGRRV